LNINDLTYKVIGCAYKVHNTLGPGFLEKVYENALILELKKLGIHVRQQVKLPVLYEGQQVGLYFPDLWIQNCLIVEIKAIRTLAPEHELKLIHYLAATSIDNGLLINFGPTVQVKRKFREYRRVCENTYSNIDPGEKDR
jgi:GxxExxY protein